MLGRMTNQCHGQLDAMPQKRRERAIIRIICAFNFCRFAGNFPRTVSSFTTITVIRFKAANYSKCDVLAPVVRILWDTHGEVSCQSCNHRTKGTGLFLEMGTIVLNCYVLGSSRRLKNISGFRQ